jgi:hypothetical protein
MGYLRRGANSPWIYENIFNEITVFIDMVTDCFIQASCGASQHPDGDSGSGRPGRGLELLAVHGHQRGVPDLFHHCGFIPDE